MIDEQLIERAEHWLLHPELHWQTTTRQFQFISGVLRHWREYKKLSQKQRRYTEWILKRYSIK
jgi:hypothetical protein